MTTFELLVLKHRLKLELKIPDFCASRSGRLTMRRCRELFPGVRTRKEALEKIVKILDKPAPGTPDPEPTV